MRQIRVADFKKLCALQCTKLEICSFFDCSEKTLENWCHKNYNCSFRELSKKFRAKGIISLRRVAWEKGLAGDKTILLHLCNVYLGQSSRQDNKTNLQIVITADSVDKIGVLANRFADTISKKLDEKIEKDLAREYAEDSIDFSDSESELSDCNIFNNELERKESNVLKISNNNQS